VHRLVPSPKHVHDHILSRHIAFDVERVDLAFEDLSIISLTISGNSSYVMVSCPSSSVNLELTPSCNSEMLLGFSRSPLTYVTVSANARCETLEVILS